MYSIRILVFIYEYLIYLVGDVKQSIYKFRQADPSLFIEKYNRFNVEGEQSGLRIDLSQNFRSRKEVLSTTNYLFKHMMDSQVGEIEYDEAAQLYYGANFDDANVPLHLDMLIVGDTCLTSHHILPVRS